MSKEVIKDNIIRRIQEGVRENLVICTDWNARDYTLMSHELTALSETFSTLSLIATKFADAKDFKDWAIMTAPMHS